MNKNKFPILDFYYYESCFYCQKVIRAIRAQHIKVNWMDIYENIGHLQKLTYITGSKTVPCLFIDGAPMHESDDIVEWINKNASHLEKEIN